MPSVGIKVMISRMRQKVKKSPAMRAIVISVWVQFSCGYCAIYEEGGDLSIPMKEVSESDFH